MSESHDPIENRLDAIIDLLEEVVKELKEANLKVYD